MEEKKEKQTPVETEEEMKARLKKEIMAELLDELKSDNVDSKNMVENKKSVDSFKKEEASEEKKVMMPKSEIHSASYKDDAIQPLAGTYKGKKLPEKQDKLPSKIELPKAPEGGNSTATLVVLCVAGVLLIIAVFFFPKIDSFLSEWRLQRNVPKPQSNTNTTSNSNEQTYDPITLESKELTTFTYPIMRNTPYDKISYYNRSSVTMSEFSNNDILYNAFIHVYNGNIADYVGSYNGTFCGSATQHKTFNAKYIDARINNLFTTETEYKHADFSVPVTNKDTSYVGTWKYDKRNNRYIYYGSCSNQTKKNDLYYDVSSIYDAEGIENNTTIYARYYVAFAHVDGSNGNYTLYSDAEMTNVLATGSLTSNNYQQELNTAFTKYLESGKDTVKTYQYTFSRNNCSYQDYCFVKGEWTK